LITPVAVLVLALAVVPVLAADSTGPRGRGNAPFDQDLPWLELELQARKLFFTATVRITVQELSAGDALREIVASGGSLEGRLPAGGPVDRIHVAGIMTTGKTEIATAWVDHDTGAVLQSIKEVHGKGNYWKLRRFFADGYHQIRKAPANRKERKAVRERWTKHEELLVRWEPSPPQGQIVTSSYALPYLLSRSHFEGGGACEAWLVPVKERLVEIQVKPAPSRRVKLKIDQLWPGGSDTLMARLDAPTVRVVPRWFDGRTDEPASTGFMGMRGPALVSLLPGCGIPIRIDGTVRRAGHVASMVRRIRFR